MCFQWDKTPSNQYLRADGGDNINHCYDHYYADRLYKAYFVDHCCCLQSCIQQQQSFSVEVSAENISTHDDLKPWLLTWKAFWGSSVGARTSCDIGNITVSELHGSVLSLHVISHVCTSAVTGGVTALIFSWERQQLWFSADNFPSQGYCCLEDLNYKTNPGELKHRPVDLICISWRADFFCSVDLKHRSNQMWNQEARKQQEGKWNCWQFLCPKKMYFHSRINGNLCPLPNPLPFPSYTRKSLIKESIIRV